MRVAPGADSGGMASGARTSERELWRGRPSRHRLFRPADAALIPASVLAAAFAFWWEAQAITDPSWPALFAIGGVPVVLGGLYLLVGRFVVRALVSRRTRYLLTDRRLTIVGGLSGIRETSTYLTALAPPVITERPDGS